MSANKQLCRSQLASILSTQRLRECQAFVEKIGEIRFPNVKQRQLNKFNNLLNKKEGNISGVSSLNSSCNLVSSQTGRRKVLTFPPGKEAIHRQAGTHLLSGEGGNLLASQAGNSLAVHSQASAHLPPVGRKQFSGISGRHSPSLWGRKQFISFLGRQLTSSSFPGTSSPSPPGKEAV